MDRQDDPALVGEFRVYRRIPPSGGRVEWSETGIPSPSSQNFKDKDDELSVYLSHETTPDAALAGHSGFGLVQFTLQAVRDVFHEHKRAVVVCRDSDDPANGHILICGAISNGMARRIKQVAQWVDGRWPARGEGS
jgi:hypothetical protein